MTPRLIAPAAAQAASAARAIVPARREPHRSSALVARALACRAARRRRQLPPAATGNVRGRPPRERARSRRDPRCVAAAALPAPPGAVPRGPGDDLGALGIAIGFPGVYYLLRRQRLGRSTTRGLLAIAAGAVLLLSGPVTLWKARRTRRKPSPDATSAGRSRRSWARSRRSRSSPSSSSRSRSPTATPTSAAPARSPDLGVPYETVTSRRATRSSSPPPTSPPRTAPRSSSSRDARR